MPGAQREGLREANDRLLLYQADGAVSEDKHARVEDGYIISDELNSLHELQEPTRIMGFRRGAVGLRQIDTAYVITDEGGPLIGDLEFWGMLDKRFLAVKAERPKPKSAIARKEDTAKFLVGCLGALALLLALFHPLLGFSFDSEGDLRPAQAAAPPVPGNVVVEQPAPTPTAAQLSGSAPAAAPALAGQSTPTPTPTPTPEGAPAQPTQEAVNAVPTAVPAAIQPVVP